MGVMAPVEHRTAWNENICSAEKPKKSQKMSKNKIDVFTVDHNKLAAFEEEKYKDLDSDFDDSGSTSCCQKIDKFFGSIFRVTSDLSLEEAEAEYEAKKEKREEEMIEIVEKKVYKTPWVFSVYGLFGSILGLAVVSIGFVLWKRENVYTNQDAWWSCIVRCGTVWVSSLTASMLINSAAWLGLPSLLVPSTYFAVTLAGSMGMMGMWSLCYLVWGPILGLPFPVPMVGAIATMAGVISILTVTHFKLPNAWRQDFNFRRRLRWHHVAQLYIIVMCAQYWTFSVLFFLCPIKIQWVLAIAMTIVREGNVLVLTAICKRVGANKDDDSLESIVNSLVIFYHQTFLSVCVAILGTDATNYVCVALDFLCNMYLLYRTYRSAKGSTRDAGELRKNAQILVVSESIGIIIPLAYLACLLVVYDGPNAVNLGNVKSDYFQWKKIDDFSKAAVNLLTLVFFDLLSSIFICLVAFFICRINLIQVWLHVIKEFGLVFAIHQTYLLDYQFCIVEIACALDFTFQFDWWLDREAWLNSTLISSDFANFSTALQSTLINTTSLN